MARIGLLGGTFDPPHNGHLILAETALRELELDRVILIPARVQPHKINRVSASADDRMKMLGLAIGGKSRLEISDVELRRDGPSYTVDTIEKLRILLPGDQLFLIMGADNVSEIESWLEPERIFDLATVAAANRPNFKAGGRFADAVIYFAMPPTNISSTEIRAKIGAGESISGLVSPDVESYIVRHRLYQKG